jgi:uncharacterized membrane protein YcfT
MCIFDIFGALMYNYFNVTAAYLAVFLLPNLYNSVIINLAPASKPPVSAVTGNTSILVGASLFGIKKTTRLCSQPSRGSHSRMTSVKAILPDAPASVKHRTTRPLLPQLRGGSRAFFAFEQL